MIRMIDADRRPSTLLSEQADDGFRTSESCDMSRWSPDVRPIDEAIADLLGITRENGETMKGRSEEYTSELQSLMRISYDVFCLKKKTKNNKRIYMRAKKQAQR